MGGAGSFLGGLGIGQSSGSDFPRKLARNPLKYLMKDADKYGIHRLAALGHSMNYPPVSIGQRRDLQRMGQGLDQMLKSFDPTTKRLRELSIQQEEAKLERYKLDTQISKRELNQLNKPTIDFKSSIDKHFGIPGQTSGIRYVPSEVSHPGS